MTTLPHKYYRRSNLDEQCVDLECTLGSEYEHERQMYEDPASWPAWPILPLKRPGYPWSDPASTGFITMYAVASPIVYLANILSLKSGTLSPQLEPMDKLRYENLVDLYDAGWRID